MISKGEKRMEITESVRYVGVNDHSIDLFEGMYKVKNGMAYNSYVILDEKVAILDTVDGAFKAKWLNNLKSALKDKIPDYLIVQHMEPDHSANILELVEAYPNVKIVSTSKSFAMMKNYFGTDFAGRQVIVKDGDKLDLGHHKLVFVTAPMVHWPEVMVTYERTEKLLFSADAFGKFGALDREEEWACEARRYYFGIVGKYGVQVQNLLKKLADYEIKTICPLHGPILKENLKYYLELYNVWSSYQAETDGVMIAYTSVYGNTKGAVELLEKELKAQGCNEVAVTDLARGDRFEAVEDAFRYKKLVLATTTYNGEIFPFMRDFIQDITERNYQNRTVGFIENGSWAPMATKVMRGMLEKCKDLQYTQANVKLLSSLSEENRKEIKALAKELCQN